MKRALHGFSFLTSPGHILMQRKGSTISETYSRISATQKELVSYAQILYYLFNIQNRQFR